MDERDELAQYITRHGQRRGADSSSAWSYLPTAPPMIAGKEGG